MSKNPEGKYYEAVERRLSPEIYKVGMANPYVGGIPDRFYEGERADLWVEYKWYNKLPVRGIDLTSGKAPKLSPLQQEWLNRRHKTRADCAVIIGWPNPDKPREKLGMILANGEWDERIGPLRYNPREGLSLDAVAAWICREVT